MLDTRERGLKGTGTPDRAGIIRSIPCFSGIGSEVEDRLIKAVREEFFPRGAALMLEGESCTGLFIVKSGSIKLYHLSSDGQEHIVRLVHAGGCFECVPFFDGGNNPVSAEALEASWVFVLPASEFRWMLGNCPEVMKAFTPILASRLRSLVAAGDLSQRQVYPRLARLLCQLSESRDGKMLVSPSAPVHQQHLACMLGCSRQVVNTSLQKLKKEGVIAVTGRRILILDYDALRRIC